jgi:phage-related protein
VPTKSNAPANEWVGLDEANNNNNEQNRHLGDLYYDTQTQYAYRWTSTVENEETTYDWALISDEGITSALAAANAAQAAADGKMKVFTNTPTVPYQIGDLWAQGKGGELMRCKNARTSGEYSSEDWEKASKYTDDTAADAA